MAREMNFERLTEETQVERPEEQSWRRTRHQANPTVQMSIRMPEVEYERFREICGRERRTNGDMLKVLIDLWVLIEAAKGR